MAKKKAKMIVEGASVPGPQWKELVRQVVDGELTGEQVQAILGRRNPFIQNTKKLSPPTSSSASVTAGLNSGKLLVGGHSPTLTSFFLLCDQG